VSWFQKHINVAYALAAVVGTVLVGAISAWIGSLVAGAAQSVKAFAGWVAGFGAVDAAEATTVAESEAAGPAITAAFGPIGILLAGLGVAAFELYQHWDTVWSGIKRIALDVWHFLESYGQWIAGAFFGPIGFLLVELAKHWSDVWGGIKDAASAVWHFLDSNIFQPLSVAFTAVAGGVGYLYLLWKQTWTDIGDALKWVWDHTLGPVIDSIKSGINDTIGLLGKVGGLLGHIPGVSSVLGAVGLGHASGGAVVGGQPILVGERGPELFVPPTSGQIIPNGQFGAAGGAGVVWTGDVIVQGSVHSKESLVEAVRDGLARLNQRSGPTQAMKLMGLA
jgi:hypothetical protein